MLENIETPSLKIIFNKDSGTFDVYSKKCNKIIIKNAYGSMLTAKGLQSTIGLEYTLSQIIYEDNVGKGTRTRLDFKKENPDDPIQFQIDIIKYQDKDFILIEIIATNDSNSEISVKYLSPFGVTASNNGGVFLGNKSPEDIVIYENGLGFAFEFYLRAFNAREESDSSMMEFLYSKTDISNNLLTGIVKLSGFLSEVISNDEEEKGIIFNDREGIAEWRPEISFPFPKKISPGESIASGSWVLMIDTPSGFDALESYADLIRAYNNIRLWKHEVPHGWNSWNNPYTLYRERCYSTDINESIILENMDVAIKNLKPFGLKYWQLDSGYTRGDIMTLDDIIEDRFPHGMKYIADKIHESGLRAGIWINPFNVGINSKIVKEKEKEGWFPLPDPSFPIKDKNWRSLDVTIPDVQNYIRRAIRKVVKEWGYDLLKIDFSYLNMAPKEFFNKMMTSSEIHRLGFQLVREEAGPDIFIFGIGGPIGLHMGILDGERISLDNMPVWEDPGVPQKMFDVPQTMGSFSFNYRNWVRRYYLNYRVWLNHLDCLSFRPSFTPNESLCMATSMALLGGIFKIGDKLIEMTPKQFNIVQKMLPIYYKSARPIDIFRMMLPEILHLHVCPNKNIHPSPNKNIYSLEFSKENGELNWEVVGIFNWGDNKNLIKEEELPFGEKEISVNFSEIGLNPLKKYHVFNFWENKYEGFFEKSYNPKLEPRHVQLISIHEDLGRPQFLSSNRHFTQGGIEIKFISWDVENKILEGNILPVEGFEHELHFFIPSEFQLESISVGKLQEVPYEMKDHWMTMKFSGDIAENQEKIDGIKWQIKFKQ